MKFRIVFIFFVALSISAMSFTNASNLPVVLSGSSVKIFAVSNSKTLMVSVSNNLNDAIEIELDDANGHVLYSETTEKVNTFSKRLNLNSLDAGFYTLVVKKNLVKTIQPFELTETSIKMSENERNEKYLPNIVQKGKKVDVNVLLNKISDVNVRVYDIEGRLVFEQISKDVQDLHKRFDLEKLAAGVYLVEVIAGDETQYATVSL